MSVVRLLLESSAGLPMEHVPAGITVARACPSRDAGQLASVIDSSHGGCFPRLSVAGVLGDLAGRPGRSVAAWLAQADATPVGLAAILEATSGRSRRFSIVWLLVSRSARRRGVGAALVATAVGHARRCGAADIWVETRGDWMDATGFWRAVGFRPAP